MTVVLFYRFRKYIVYWCPMCSVDANLEHTGKSKLLMKETCSLNVIMFVVNATCFPLILYASFTNLTLIANIALFQNLHCTFTTRLSWWFSPTQFLLSDARNLLLINQFFGLCTSMARVQVEFMVCAATNSSLWVALYLATCRRYFW